MHRFPLPKTFILLCTLLLAVLNFKCKSPEKVRELDKMEWLTGRWEKEAAGIKTIETWNRKPDKSYRVAGLMLEGRDTIFTETITVKPGKTGIEYSVVIPDQNNGRPVIFKLTENTGARTTFENPDHDFPQKITYTRLTPDSLRVELKGTLKGKPVSETYPLKKQ